MSTFRFAVAIAGVVAIDLVTLAITVAAPRREQLPESVVESFN